MIPFNVPAVTGNEWSHLQEVFKQKKFSGDGPFTRKCESWIEQRFGARKALLTTSGTDALELAALLTDIQPGDEVIMPSYTFSSTATAFALRGAHIVFVDIQPHTMNINEQLIEAAISERTKVIVPVHYAGVGCEMDTIMRLAEKYSLFVVEDAAQGVMSTYKDRPLGTIGHLGCYSFHETKNYQCGEGGALLINDARLIERAEVLREKGTDRAKFFRGEVDQYSWMDIGSSFLPSELNAAVLYAQFEQADHIFQNRLISWNRYFEGLTPLATSGHIQLPSVPPTCRHNAHLFYLKVKDIDERRKLIDHLKQHGVMAISHYVPLHSSVAGRRFGRFHGEDVWTTRESERLIRLPLFFEISAQDIDFIILSINRFYGMP